MLRRNETSQGQIRMPSPRRAVLAAAALLAAWALPAQAQMGPPGPPTIGTVAAQKRAVTESSEFTGRIQAAARVDVVARVTAFIEARTFTEGGEVQEGELLFRLDPATFQARSPPAKPTSPRPPPCCATPPSPSAAPRPSSAAAPAAPPR